MPGRPQRLGQVDAAEDRRRADRARPRRALRAAGRDRPLPAAGAGSRRATPRRWPMSKPGSARPTIRIRRAICWSSSASPATKIPRSFRAARRGARRSPTCWRRDPTSCCSTSRPTISTCRPSNGWRRTLAGQRAALVLISHDRRFLENLSRTTVWLDRGRTRRVELGFGAVRGLARRAAGGGGGRPAQARPQDRARGALGALRRHRPAQAQRAPHGRAAGAAPDAGATIAAPPARP